MANKNETEEIDEAPDVTIAIEVNVDRALYNRIKKFGEDNKMPQSIKAHLKSIVEKWFTKWEALLDEAERQGEAQTIVTPDTSLLGPDGEPMGRA